MVKPYHHITQIFFSPAAISEWVYQEKKGGLELKEVGRADKSITRFSDRLYEVIEHAPTE